MCVCAEYCFPGGYSLRYRRKARVSGGLNNIIFFFFLPIRVLFIVDLVARRKNKKHKKTNCLRPAHYDNSGVREQREAIVKILLPDPYACVYIVFVVHMVSIRFRVWYTIGFCKLQHAGE